MTNFYITDDLKLRKIMGYKSFYHFTHTETQEGEEVEINDPIDAMYPANFGGIEYLLVASRGMLYSFLKSKIEDDWDIIGEEEPPESADVPGKAMTQEYQSITTSFPVYVSSGEVRVYCRYTSQNEDTKKTNYQIKVTLYCRVASKFINSLTTTCNNRSNTIRNRRLPAGETTIFEETFEAQHDAQGVSPSIYERINMQLTTDSGTTTHGTRTLNFKFPTIGVIPIYGVEPTPIGRIGNGDVSFFTFDKKVYVLSGLYQSISQEEDPETHEPVLQLNDVNGYIPLVYVNTPPAGGGTLYEEINILTSKKHQTINGDGTSTTYFLADNLERSGYSPAIDKILINGVEIPDSQYTPAPIQGSVTFDTAPPQGTDNVDIYWGFYNVDEQGGLTPRNPDRHIIEGMRYGTVFGGDLDIRVFLYGNIECINRTYFSAISYVNDVAVPSVEYFPATAFVDVGPSNFRLTDLTRQYDRLLATTNRPEAYYMTISTEQLPITLGDGSNATRYVPAVSTFPLNEAHGNMAMGQGQLIDNFPVTVDKTGLALWKATNVRDEKNMEIISQRLDFDLMNLTMSAFKTMDFQARRQLWFGYDNNIYIYNYYNKTFSRLLIYDSLTCYSELGNNAYMGLSDGRIVKWGEEFPDFDGQTISAHWEMNFEDFETAYLRKTMRKVWVLMQPQGYSSAEIGYISNKEESASKKRIEYHITVFDDVDFRNFSFKVSLNPQPYRLKLKAKKFTNLKLTIDNNENTDCTILQLVLNVESFGESK